MRILLSALLLSCSSLALGANLSLDLTSGTTGVRCFTTMHEDGSWSHVEVDLDSWVLLGGADIQSLTDQPAVLAHFVDEGIETYSDYESVIDSRVAEQLLQGPGPLWAVEVDPPADPGLLEAGDDEPIKWNAVRTGKTPPCDDTKVKDCKIMMVIKGSKE